MELYSKKTYLEMRKILDDNPYDLSGFTACLSEQCSDLSATDIDDVKDFIEQEMEIESDAEICEIDDESIVVLCEYINEIIRYVNEDD